MDSAKPETTRGSQQGRHNGGRPSRLEMMREDYHKRLMKEKEEKLIQMYQENQKKAMTRLMKTGPENTQNVDDGLSDRKSVREFFNERRRMEANGVPMPPIQHHYQVSKGTSSTGEGSSSSTSRSSSKNRQINLGRDRLYPLAPIQRTQKTHDATTSIETRNQQTLPVDRERNNNPLTGRHHFDVHKPVPTANSHFTDYDNIDRSVDSEIRTPPAKLVKPSPLNKRQAKQQLQLLQPQPPTEKSCLQEPDMAVLMGSEDKLTDFQKWSMQQKKPRDKPLKKASHNNTSNNCDDSGHEKDDSNYVNENTNYSSNSGNAAKGKETGRLGNVASQKKEMEKMERMRDIHEEEKLAMTQKRKPQLLGRTRPNKLVDEKKNETYRNEQENGSSSEKHGENTRLNDDEMKNLEGKEHVKGEDTRRHKEKQFNIPAGKKEQTAHQSAVLSAQITDNSDNRQALDKNQLPSPTKRNVSFSSNSKTLQLSISNMATTYQQDGDIFLSNVKVNEQTDVSLEDGSSLSMCQLCGRSFLPERLTKHQNACAKSNKPRKQFDSSKKRAEGSELTKLAGKARKQEQPKKKSNWRTKHDELIQSLRYARKVTQYEKDGIDTRQLTPPAASTNPDYVPCPHCGRTFNGPVAERHIPQCQQLNTRPSHVNTKRR